MEIQSRTRDFPACVGEVCSPLSEKKKVCMEDSPATPPRPTAKIIHTKGFEEWFSHRLQPRVHAHIANTQPAFVYRAPRSCAGVY